MHFSGTAIYAVVRERGNLSGMVLFGRIFVRASIVSERFGRNEFQHFALIVISSVCFTCPYDLLGSNVVSFFV